MRSRAQWDNDGVSTEVPIADDVIAWLLAADEASVRFFTLTTLLGEPDGAAGVEAARRAIMTSGSVPQILARQGEDGHWGERDAFYSAKYTGTSWTLLILAELGADGGDERVRRGCEALLRDAQDSAGGGFSVDRARKTGGGQHARVIPCLTGNMVFSLIRLGMLADPRVQQGVDWITTWARFDDGDGEPPDVLPYRSWQMCWGRHTCFMGAVKLLKALAEIPDDRRSPAVRRTLAEGTEFLLRHHVYKRSHDLSQTAKPGWRRFGFPLMYQTDVLEILDVLVKLGVRDERMQEAIDLIVTKRDGRGCWALAQTFNGRFHVDIENKGEPSRWLTLRALRVLHACAESAGLAPTPP